MSYLYEQADAGRWIPPWLRHQNRARYEWAAELCAGKRVIEVGCGNGAGTAILAGAAERVDGFDVDADAIEVARQRATGAVAFALTEPHRLPVEDRVYEVAVSLEAIEHVDDDRGFVAEIARVLRDDGALVCSTPNRALTNPGTSIEDRPFNRHHVREYTAEELRAVLESRFADVALLGQSGYRDRYRRLLGAVGRRAPRIGARLHQVRKLAGIPFESIERHRPFPLTDSRHPEVLLAVCREPRR